MNGTCGVCDAPLIDGAHLCHKDTRKLDARLRDVPGLTWQLELTEHRQAQTRAASGPSRKGEALPWNERAAKAREQLEGVLHSWAAYTRAEATHRILETVWDPELGETVTRPKKANPAPPATPRAADVAVWLTGWLHWLRRQDTAPDMFDEVTGAIVDAHAAIDAPVQLHMIGVCRQPLRDADGEVLWPPQLCTQRLYAERRATAMTCPRCGAFHSIKDRRQQALAAAEDYHRPAAFMTRFLVAAGYSIGASTIRAWASKGLIHPTGTDPKTSRPVYRVGDVLDAYHRHNQPRSLAA